MTQIRGLVIYEIRPDGCLLGLWSDDSRREFKCEIAKKETNDPNQDISGRYITSWIEDEAILNGVLTISHNRERGGLDLEWVAFSRTERNFDNVEVTPFPRGNRLYIGFGLLLNNTLNATYWSA